MQICVSFGLFAAERVAETCAVSGASGRSLCTWWVKPSAPRRAACNYLENHLEIELHIIISFSSEEFK
jgi:hypothetical protein